MQTARTLTLALVGFVVWAQALPVLAQDDPPPDPELGFLPPAEDMPEAQGEAAESDPELGALPPPPGEQEQSGGRDLAPRKADSTGRHGQQSQVLSRHQFRIELGPPDFALRDSGFLGEGRGLRMGRADIDAPGVGGFYGGLGFGLAVGVLDNLEVGILQLPVIFDTGYDGAAFGNLEMYGRYGALRGEKFELGASLVLQVPTHNAFGTGFGMPVRILATDALIIDTGLELEIVRFTGNLKSAGTAVNLDMPIAVNYYIVPEAFVGGRIGLFVLDFDDLYIPLGVQGGYALKDGMVQLTGWFEWAAVPLGELRFSTEYLDAGSFEFGVGCNVLLDFGR